MERRSVMILMILKRNKSVMILKFLFISRLCVNYIHDHFRRMATIIIDFQEKVRKKWEEVNNNNESLVCDICSVIGKSSANLRKYKQRTHDNREYLE